MFQCLTSSNISRGAFALKTVFFFCNIIVWLFKWILTYKSMFHINDSNTVVSAFKQWHFEIVTVTVTVTVWQVTRSFVTEISGFMEIQVCHCLQILVCPFWDHSLPPWGSDFTAFIMKVYMRSEVWGLISMVANCDLPGGKLGCLSSSLRFL